jgi:aspartyl-tRNA(Asn)/glutamyl-tRNA(Gln) amidotransferase subunit A
MSRTSEIAFLTAVEMREAFRSKSLSPVELTQAVLERINQHNQRYNAYCLVNAESVIIQARASEERWMHGEPLGDLDGVPTAIKDLLLTRGWPTLRGSLAINPNQDWRDDAPVVERLRRSGAVLVGKTTTPELGWKGVTDSPLTGITRNPWDESRTTGGSSGGSAAAVVLGMATLAVGTDGGGSIRIPAGFCGCTGLKPTFGRVPMWPVSPFGSLAHTGPMTRTVADTALMMDVIARPHACERKAAKVFEDLGAHVEELNAPFDDLLDLFTVLWHAGAAQALSSYESEARAKMDPGLLEIGAEGSSYSLMSYLEAIMQRASLGVKLSQFHERFDVLLTPTLPLPAFEAGHEVPQGWPERRWQTWTPFSYPFNLTQQPAISVPCGMTTSGLPIGLQLVGAKYRDALVLRAAHAYETSSPMPRRPPEVL